MSQSRKIKLFSTSGKLGKQEVESRASTLEELKKELTDMGINLNGMSLNEFNSQKELSSTQDLPEGELKLYILPAQVTSGKML